MKEFREARLCKVYSIEGQDGVYDRITKKDAEGDDMALQAHIGDSISWFRPSSLLNTDSVKQDQEG